MGANRRGVWGEESGTVGLTPRSEPSETTLRLWRETVACALGERGETEGPLGGSSGHHEGCELLMLMLHGCNLW